MITVDDVLFHIAQRLGHYSDADPEAAIEEFIYGYVFDLHLAITDNVEETENDFMDRYGAGETFYFRLSDYEHGKLLAGQMYYIFLGHKPDMSTHTGDHFPHGAHLYLFVHVRSKPKPAEQAET